MAVARLYVLGAASRILTYVTVKRYRTSRSWGVAPSLPYDRFTFVETKLFTRLVGECLRGDDYRACSYRSAADNISSNPLPMRMSARTEDSSSPFTRRSSTAAKRVGGCCRPFAAFTS